MRSTSFAPADERGRDFVSVDKTLLQPNTTWMRVTPPEMQFDEFDERSAKIASLAFGRAMHCHVAVSHPTFATTSAVTTTTTTTTTTGTRTG